MYSLSSIIHPSCSVCVFPRTSLTKQQNRSIPATITIRRPDNGAELRKYVNKSPTTLVNGKSHFELQNIYKQSQIILYYRMSVLNTKHQELLVFLQIYSNLHLYKINNF